MTGPLPHTIDFDDVLLAVEFGETKSVALIGVTERRSSGERVVVEHHRLRWQDGVLYHDKPARRSRVTMPAIDAEDYLWQTTAFSAASGCLGPVITYTPAYTWARKTDLTKALDTIAAVSGKSVGLSGLVSVTVHPLGATLVSHGDAQVMIELHQLDHTKDPARDDLGTVVVLAEHLRRVTKEQSQAILELRILADGDLRVGAGTVWTTTSKSARPISASTTPGPLPLGLTAALTRALPFAGNDPARPALHHVQLRHEGERVQVFATDGNRLYVEWLAAAPCPFCRNNPGQDIRDGLVVDCPDCGGTAFMPGWEGLLAIPRRLLERVCKPKARVQVGYSEAGVFVFGGGLQFRCPRHNPHAPPPIESIVGMFIQPEHQLPSNPDFARKIGHKSWVSIALDPLVVERLTKWLAEHHDFAAVGMYVGARGSIRAFTQEGLGVRILAGDCGDDLPPANPNLDVADVGSRYHPTEVPRVFKPGFMLSALEAATSGDSSPLTLSIGQAIDAMILRNNTRCVVIMPMRGFG